MNHLFCLWSAGALLTPLVVLAGCASAQPLPSLSPSAPAPVASGIAYSPGKGSGAFGLGINLEGGSNDWGGDRLFADVMKTVRDFQKSTGSGYAPTDATGWPTSDFSFVAFDLPRAHGTYALSFTGQAKVNAFGAKIGPLSYNPQTNVSSVTMTVDTPDKNAPTVVFNETRRAANTPLGSGVTDIVMMRPIAEGATTSYPARTLFTTPIKTLLRRFSAIRFMDYAATNSNPITRWSQRSKPIDVSFQRDLSQHTFEGPTGANKGAPWELAVQLCNETGKDLWLNVPARADDDYVRQLARLLRFGSNGDLPLTAPGKPRFAPLAPERKICVEYSNEVWNYVYGFSQSDFNRAEASRLVESNAPEAAILNYDHLPLDKDADGHLLNRETFASRRYALRVKQISDIFREVFGSSAMGTRVRPLLLWQYDNLNDTARNRAAFLENYFGNGDGRHVAAPHPLNYYVWGGGGGWYGGLNDEKAADANALYASGVQNIKYVETEVRWCRAFGLVATGYEGGFRVGGDNPTPTQLAANLDPRAKDASVQTIRSFFKAGGDFPFIFQSAGTSAYALASPTVFDQNTPKLQAVDELNAGPRITPELGIAAPGAGQTVTLGAGDADLDQRMGNLKNGARQLIEGSWLNWTILVKERAPFSVRVNASAGATLELLVDGSSQASGAAPSAPLALAPGVHSLRVRCQSGASALSSVELRR